MGQRFAKVILNARKKAGVLQLDIAREFKYTTAQFISNWECGHSMAPPYVLKRLSQLIKVDPNVLVRAMVKDYEEELRAYL